eukprot:1223267-Prorocentrum_lima.AAC.1
MRPEEGDSVGTRPDDRDSAGVSPVCISEDLPLLSLLPRVSTGAGTGRRSSGSGGSCSPIVG